MTNGNNQSGAATDPAGPTPPKDSPPSHSQILAQLDLILKSDQFAGAARQQRLLRHLVTKRLDGSLGDLKEYTLGVEVFDRGDDFDPRLDPIVRVEASRLRSRLQKYYDSLGTQADVRITLPRGAYLPSFSGPLPPPEPSAESSPAEIAVSVNIPDRASALWKQRLRWMAATAVAATVLAGTGIWFSRRPAARPAPRYLRFRRVTNDETLCTSPSFSPDDRQLVYARHHDGTWRLYHRELDTSGWTELTPGSDVDNYQPAWSPDGKSIAFRSEREGGGLFLLNMQSRNVTPVLPNGYSPSWSPDGQNITFATGTFSDPVEAPAGSASSIDVFNFKSKQMRRLAAGQGGTYSALQPAWSPHGYRIAFWEVDASGKRDILTVDARATDPASAHPVYATQDSWTNWSPAWSADGRYLYYSSDRGGSMNLWRVAINEKSGEVKNAPEPVTTPSSYTGWSTFSHSGDAFAYVRRIPYSELYKVDYSPSKPVDLTARTQLTFGERSMHEPEVSPDGQWIAVRVQDPQEDLAVVRSDGSQVRRLTNDVYTQRNPHWSPDGKQIEYISNRSGQFEVWSIKPDGTGARQLTHKGALHTAWTPDNSLVAYPAHEPSFVIDPQGDTLGPWSLPQALRPNVWSPDGKWVSATMQAGSFGAGGLFLFSPSTHDYWQIGAASGYSSNVWLPDSQELLFTSIEGIYLADVKTRQVKQQLSIARTGIHSHMSLSPEGNTLYFVESNDQEDIWTGSE